ncbi:MAG TPA: hypothetical protein VG755_06335 [Nannocystaceae bacterium]|nr:hypothetical protein [Nannocystaceae bacterium]
MYLALAISLLLSAPSAPPDVVPQRAAPSAIQPLVLHVPAADLEPLRDALANRLPTVSVHPHRAAVLDALRGHDLLYAELVPTGVANEERLVVILEDGRSFERTFTVDEVDRVHSIATTLANTIAAIREERIEPTRTDAEIPAAAPEPVEPAQPEPTAPPPVAAEPTVRTPVDTTPPQPPSPVRRWELGLVPYGGLLVGLGPHGIATSQGNGGLDLDVRAPIGVLLSVGARYATRQLDGARIHRTAVTIGSGYVLRRAAFELRLAGALVIEPWLVTDRGSAKTVREANGQRATPMIGAIVSASPGWYWRKHEQSPVALRLGMRALLQLSALTSGGMANVRLLEGDDPPRSIARLGGAELMLGLDAALWFTLARR